MSTDPLTTAYLAALHQEASRLPWNTRVELLADVRNHIEVALAEMRDAAAEAEAEVEAGAGYGGDGSGGHGGDRDGGAGQDTDASAPIAADRSTADAASSTGAVTAADRSAVARASIADDSAVDFGAASATSTSSAATAAAAGTASAADSPAVDFGESSATPASGAISAADSPDLHSAAISGVDSSPPDPAGHPTADAADPATTAYRAMAAAAAEDPSPSPEAAQIRAILAALGDPAEIVAAALADDPTPHPEWPSRPIPAAPITATAPTAPIITPPPAPGPPYRLGLQEVAALTLLLAGGFLYVVGWVFGALFLWNSPRWTRRQKLLGTFVFPGGLYAVWFLLNLPVSSIDCVTLSDGTTHCTQDGWTLPSWMGLPVAFLLVAVPVTVTLVLARAARQHPGTTQGADRATSSTFRTVLTVLGGIAALMFIGGGLFLIAGGNSSSSDPDEPIVSHVATYPGAPAPGSGPESSSGDPASSPSPPVSSAASSSG